MLIDVKGFLNSFKEGDREIVSVYKDRLKLLLEENKLYSTLKNRYDELIAITATQSKEIERLLAREQELLDINEVQHEKLTNAEATLFNQEKSMKTLDKKLGAALDKAKDRDTLKNKLELSNGLIEYGRQQKMIDSLTEPVIIDI